MLYFCIENSIIKLWKRGFSKEKSMTESLSGNRNQMARALWWYREQDVSANLGYVYENLVAQMLTAAGNKLFYYTFEKDDKHSYEVDFLLSRGNKICPIEVKSSGYKTHASLDAFRRKYSARIKNSYLIYTKDLQIGDHELMYLPFYMTSMI